MASLDFLEKLGRAYGQGMELEVATRLVDFLSRHQSTTYVNLQLVRQISPGANTGVHDAAILRALQFLAGDAIQILDVRFEIFDDEDFPHKLSEEEARAALNFAINPLTGDRDPDIRNKVAVYFAPSEKAQHLLAKGVRSEDED